MRNIARPIRRPVAKEIPDVWAARDRTGRPRFNIAQRIWLYPGVRMNWSSRLSRAVEALAVNILAPAMSRRRASDWADESLRQLARKFAADILLTMPAAGGYIPRDAIVEWLKSRNPTSVRERRRQTA